MPGEAAIEERSAAAPHKRRPLKLSSCVARYASSTENRPPSRRPLPADADHSTHEGREEGVRASVRIRGLLLLFPCCSFRKRRIGQRKKAHRTLLHDVDTVQACATESAANARPRCSPLQG
ncbi:hypothetical protein MRX96_035126 [Rhipicephalus microplus]